MKQFSTRCYALSIPSLEQAVIPAPQPPSNPDPLPWMLTPPALRSPAPGSSYGSRACGHSCLTTTPNE